MNEDYLGLAFCHTIVVTLNGCCHCYSLEIPVPRIFQEYRSMLNVPVYPAHPVAMFLKRMICFRQWVSAYLRPIRGIYGPYSNSVSRVTNDNRVARWTLLRLFKYGG